MGLFNNIYKGVESWFVKRADDGTINIESALRKDFDKPHSEQINYEAKMLAEKNIGIYKMAVTAATDPENPSWKSLWELYDSLMLDNHLASIIDSRILYAQRSPFKLVDEKGKEDEDASKLLERPWHDDLIYKAIMSKFQGRTLIEMYDMTEDGELRQITEIPQPNFNTKKGVITKDMDGDTGFSYRDEIFKNFYVQIGRDSDMGMLERLAIIVLAKKLGFGSWLDWIEKYGVPPLFITTDREDPGRLKQLVAAAQNFKSAHFMVGKGNEKFEIGNQGGSSIAPFNDLTTRCNDEMSKRVLGGSGITDEKAFVGSSEIQFRLAKDRFEADKQFYKYLFNAEIKPRLVNLSPVYASFANLSFEWDDTESLDLQGIIDAVTTLGTQYDIDPKYITQVTGIPILGKKEIPITPATEDDDEDPAPAGGKDGKKKNGL